MKDKMQPKANALTINAVFALSLTALLTACSHSSDEAPSSSASSESGSVLGGLRPKVDPKILQKLKAKNMVAQPLVAAEDAAQGGQSSGLPVVSSAPFAPPADQVVSGNQQASAPALPFFPFMAPQSTPQSSGVPSSPGSVPPSPAASYGGYGSSVPPAPPAPGGLIPPPPAVSLSTQAQTVPYGAPPEAYMNPYANPYMNPYANPYGNAAPNPFMQGGDARPAGSPFASGGAVNQSNGGDEEAKPKKKLQDFTPITPTGMEARSATKQRDDLKTLLKGALSMSPQLQSEARDKDIALSLSKLDVGMPPESSRGSITLSARQIEQLYKPVALDKKVAVSVRKILSDVAQDYYRYLYAYNKFALAQQTVAARKQETEVAESAAEQQRAAADMSQAQQAAESARDDLKVAQNELAATAGAAAARTVIARVSGVAPSIDSLAQAERQALAQAKNDMSSSSSGGGILGLLGFGSSKHEEVQELNAQPKALPPAQPKKAEAKKPDAKKGKVAGKPLPGDLVQAPVAQAVKPVAQVPDLRLSSGGNDCIAFELRNLNVTPRKSILKVAIRNTGSENLTFDPDAISIMENNRKLSDAAVRADFETTLVAPSKEVSGTITIFGHPWNDRISVYLSDAGGKNIPLRR
ncbi:MAG: hypothetical protein K2Y22_05185 [Candidatus Obscuribacterales bacterium]|nr:hypothetical protein [Candidatus Obscuribacterales bacterium]